MDTSDTSPNRIPSPSASSPSTSLWRSAAYRRWFAADTSDVVAVNLRAFVIPLIALQLSGSAFAAGLIVTIESAIGLVLMPIGGTLTDRHDRRRMMIGLGVIGLILSLAATALLGVRAMTIGLFAVLVMAFAVMNGLLGPSNDAILKSIVPMDRFAKAQAVREAREACVELSGGAIGGLLYTVGSWFPFLTSAALYGVAAVTAVGLPADSGHGGHRDGEAPASFVAHFIEGWRWAMTCRTVVAAIAQGAVANVACYGSVIGVQIMLASHGTDAVLIGAVGVGSGLAALVGSLIAGRLVDRVPTGALIIATFAVFSAAMVPLLFTDSYPVIVACMTVSSLLFPALNAGELGFIYGKTPDDMQGRMSAAFETSVGVPGALTPAMVGWLLQRFGWRTMMALVVACALIALILACTSATRSIPRPEQWDGHDL